MTAPAAPSPGVLLELAAEAVVSSFQAPAPPTAKAIDRFGPGIVAGWADWLGKRPPTEQADALADLAATPPDEARRRADDAVGRMAPGASPSQRGAAVDYLAALPCAAQRSLASDRSGRRRLPPGDRPGDPAVLFLLLPADLPPYAAPCALTGTEYRLEGFVGSGGFGAVYRASGPSLQYLPLAIKFCLDPSLLPALRQERDNLERLMRAGGAGWSPRVVRLYGYDLDHATPFLVYEYVPGNDAARWVATSRATERAPTAEQVLGLMTAVCEGLAFAHGRGLVHRDLKPANVLLGTGGVKLADFGIGGVAARQAMQQSRIGTVLAGQLTAADQRSLCRGAGTPLYMSPEQRRGEAPDPRQDVYSFGVMWYQLLLGDVTRELHPGWARELEARYKVPRGQIDLIARCVGWVEERPRDAGELLREVQQLAGAATPTEKPAPAPTAVPAAVPVPTSAPSLVTDSFQRALLVTRLRQIEAIHGRVRWHADARVGRIVACVFLALLLGGIAWGVAYESWSPKYIPNTQNDAEMKTHVWRVNEANKYGFVVGLYVGVFAFACLNSLSGVLTRRALAAAERELAARIGEVQAELPQQCQVWGGAAVLREPELVSEVLRDLEGRRSTDRPSV